MKFKMGLPQMDGRYKHKQKPVTKQSYYCCGCGRKFQFKPIIPNPFFPKQIFCCKNCKSNTLRKNSTDGELLRGVGKNQRAIELKEKVCVGKVVTTLQPRKRNEGFD